MNSKIGMVVAGIVMVALIGGGAYMLGKSQVDKPAQMSASKTGNSTQVDTSSVQLPTAKTPLGSLPGGVHPPIGTPLPTASTKNKYTHFRVGNSNVKAILADGDFMWIGTSGGVIKYDTRNDEYRLFDVRSGLLSNGIFHLSRMNEKLVVGTYGGGLSLLNLETEKWENFNIQHGLADAFVYDLLELKNGDIWIATWSGANRVRQGRFDDPESWDTFTVENTQGGLPNDWVYGLRAGVNGEVWMATEGGLARYKDNEWTNWAHKDGLGAPYEMVREQIEFTRDPAKESSHHARQKIEQGLTGVDIAYNPNYIVALEVADDGSVWAGTWGGGLAHYDGSKWKNYTVADGLPANHVFMLKKDNKGNLWIGTSAGLVRHDGEKYEVYTSLEGLYANNVFSFAIGKGDNLWVGSYGGVTRFEGYPSK